MINRHLSTKTKTQPCTLVSFGRANLVRIGGGNYELRGGSDDEFTAAKEWVSLFLHEACLERCDGPILHRRETSSSRWKVSSLGRSE
jgi:hypothetical protein